MKGVPKVGWYLRHYTSLKKTVKSLKMGGTVVNCALFNALYVYKTMNANTKISAHGRKALDIRNKESNLGQFTRTVAAREETNIKENKYETAPLSHPWDHNKQNWRRILLLGRERKSTVQECPLYTESAVEQNAMTKCVFLIHTVCLVLNSLTAQHL